MTDISDVLKNMSVKDDFGFVRNAVRRCIDNITKNDIWDKTMTEVTMIGIPHDFFYAIQRELEDD